MDIAKSFTFMFEDPDWQRKLGTGVVVTLVGFLLSIVLIGIVPLIMVAGYCLEVASRVLASEAQPLPEWQDWGRFLSRGFKLVVALFVWFLPLIVVSLPLGLIGSALNNQNGSASTLGALFVGCSTCLNILWGLLVAVFSPAIYVALARTDRLAAALEVGKLWTFTRDNISNVIVALLLCLVASLIASFVAPLGVIALVIGLLVTIPLAAFWYSLVQAHLFGQVGLRSTSVTE